MKRFYNNNETGRLNFRLVAVVLLAALWSLQQVSFAGIMLGGSGNLVFDFIDGNFDPPVGPVPNQIDVSQIRISDLNSNTDVVPGSGFMLDDFPNFPDYRKTLLVAPPPPPANVAFAELIEFTFYPTDNVEMGALPDTFAFYIFNVGLTASLLSTTDPTGNNALFTYDIGENLLDPKTEYDPTESDPLTTWDVILRGDGGYDVTIVTRNAGVIPEPASVVLWSLMAVGIGVCALKRRRPAI